MNGLFSFYKKTSFLFSLFGTCAIISLLLKCVTEPCGVCYTSILIQKEKLSWIRILTFRCSLAISHLMKFRFFFLSFFFFNSHIHSLCRFLGQGSNQSRSWGLCHSHSNTRSELHLHPTLQLVSMPDP